MNKNHRECGSCTKCCEGWLSAKINGHLMYPGRNCFFLAAGKCTIYENRPSTCDNYNCAWKIENNVFPEWMRPDLAGIIITKIIHPMQSELNHYEIIEAGGKLTVNTLNWLIQWALENEHNIYYEIEGKHHIIGSSHFKSYMSNR
jgi:Fe-S-cluster containining protein